MCSIWQLRLANSAVVDEKLAHHPMIGSCATMGLSHCTKHRFQVLNVGQSRVNGSTPIKTCETARHFAVRLVRDLAFAEVQAAPVKQQRYR